MVRMQTGHFRGVLYNCLSLLSPGRCREIAHELHADAVLLTGTRCRTWTPGRRYHLERLGGGYSAIHFPWQPGPLTNRSAGCSVILGRRLRLRQVRSIAVAPAALAGRGGVVRLKSGASDITLVVGYPPPSEERDTEGSASAKGKAARQTLQWI